LRRTHLEVRSANHRGGSVKGEPRDQDQVGGGGRTAVPDTDGQNVHPVVQDGQGRGRDVVRGAVVGDGAVGGFVQGCIRVPDWTAGRHLGRPEDFHAVDPGHVSVVVIGGNRHTDDLGNVEKVE